LHQTKGRAPNFRLCAKNIAGRLCQLGNSTAVLRYLLGVTLPAPYIARQAPHRPFKWKSAMNDLSPATSTSDLGPLPQWELGDLYKSPADPELEADLARAATDSKALRKSWEGKLGTSSGCKEWRGEHC